jgi:hypothetical protein
MDARRRLWVLVAVAVTLTAADLAQKAAHPVYGHPRGIAFMLVAALLATALVVFVPRVPSLALSVCGGVAAAGALGNLIAAFAWRNGVPNPIVAGAVAFNVADVYAVVGAGSLIVCAALFALRHPALLRQPV